MNKRFCPPVSLIHHYVEIKTSTRLIISKTGAKNATVDAETTVGHEKLKFEKYESDQSYENIFSIPQNPTVKVSSSYLQTYEILHFLPEKGSTDAC